LTVYDKYGRDFALAETGALQIRPSLYSRPQWQSKRLLARGSQDEWASALFAPAREPRGFLMYGSPGELSFNPLSPNRHARIGVDVPFKHGVAQMRITGASGTRGDLAHDHSLKPMSFFASSALMDSSLLGHALLKVSDRASVTFYAARSISPIFPDAADKGRTHYSAERQAWLLAQGDLEQEQRKSAIGLGYWLRPDNRTVIGLNASVIEQSGGWYDLTFHMPGEKASTRILNLGGVASRRIGDWQASVSAEVSRLRTTNNGLFNFSLATMVSGEASIQRSGILYNGSTADSLTFALSVPPRAVSGRLNVEHMARTEDGLGRRLISFSHPLSRMGAEKPKLQAAYRVSGDKGWSLGLASGVDLGGKSRVTEVLVELRLGI
jgi:hypothetical protein